MWVTAPSKYVKGKVNMKCVYLGNCQIGKQSCPTSFPWQFRFLGNGETGLGSTGHVNRKCPDFVSVYIYISNYDKNRQRLSEMCLIFSHLSNYTKMEKCMVGAKGQCG